MLTGWKAYLGVAVLVASALLHGLGYTAVANAVEALGMALGVSGIRAKQERVTPASAEPAPRT